MLTYKGKYNEAVVFTENIEQEAVSQLIQLCDLEFMKDSKIRVMPDVHSGKGCTVGTTLTIGDKVIPNLVGVDIGCGMYAVMIADHADAIDLPRLDEVIKKYVPLGHEVRDMANMKFYNQIKDELASMASAHNTDLVRAKLSIGSLGGGNHFIELDVDDEGHVYLVIHTGSRNIGKQVAVHYQNLAYAAMLAQVKNKNEMITALRASGREREIMSELKKMPAIRVSKDLAYVEGKNFDDYLHDMGVMQHYAHLNRLAIADAIMVGMRWTLADSFSTVHNYIDLKSKILRKGAVSAQAGERLLIPINNEDGALICTGLGNPDWNNSAPHGAGRLMSRKKAKATLSVEEYKEGLNNAGVYTTTANKSTVDECKKAYKPMDEIVANIADTVRIEKIIKPIYNIKAGEED